MNNTFSIKLKKIRVVGAKDQPHLGRALKMIFILIAKQIEAMGGNSPNTSMGKLFTDFGIHIFIEVKAKISQN